MKRIRGERPDDSELVSAELRQLFGKGSTPDPDATKYPNATEIRDLLDRVHKRTIEELTATSEDVFNELTGEPPHPMFRTKLEALSWCAQHEFIHAGQIGLLRRLLGEKWVR